ncbi:hypothetical protein [Afipia sp. P52-10]|uniref:hypothetical protein n=1 Tax=Afipia sp. P52-10 TaxID=1429916 RepID=UPI001268C919|nr:hypothetical protein [Afipia sp. P52-10]
MALSIMERENGGARAEKGKFNRSFKLFAARRASHDGCDPRLRLQPPYGKDRPRPAHPAAVDSRDRFLDFAVSLL